MYILVCDFLQNANMSCIGIIISFRIRLGSFKERSRSSSFSHFLKTLILKTLILWILFPIENLMLSTSFMSLNAFLRILSYLLQLKITWISLSVTFFSQFLQILISSWRLYHLVMFVAKLWDENLILVMALLLLKLLEALLFNEFFCLWIKSYSFHFCECKGGFGYSSPWPSLLAKLKCLISYISSHLFHLSTPWIYSRWC